MSRIGKEYILLVSRASVHAAFMIRIVADVRTALKTWGAASRSSPIFAIDSATPPDLGGKGEVLLAFIGPMRPEELPPGFRAFLSFGLYNVVAFAKTNDEKAELKKFLDSRRNAPWELWTLAGEFLAKVEFSPVLDKKFAPVKVHQIGSSARLRSATDEYQTLVAVAKARSLAYIPEVEAELAIFETPFEQQLRTLKVHSIRKLQWLVNVNAALSRFSSQTYAGTSPILGSECHFWTHSLLGIGVASMALLNLRRQVESAAIKAAFLDRIYAMRDLPASEQKLGSVPSNDAWWVSAELPAPKKAATSSDAARLPLVVYYSGRDGFKSTTFTLSAPLEVLHGANTYAWSLQTVTHELSHVLVERIISAVLDGDIDSPEWLVKIGGIHSGSAAPSNLFERVQQLLIEACIRLEWERNRLGEGEDVDVSLAQLPEVVSRNYQDVSELLAHLFDFIYFYDQNRETYIRSIWSSWDVIPNIKSRVSNYIDRSLFSLHFTNFTIKNSIEVTVDQLAAELQGLSLKIKDQQYIGHALELLVQHRSEFVERVNNRLLLMKFAKTAMFSAEAVRAFVAKPAASSRAKRRAEALRPLVFETNRPVQNPLAFIAETSKHEDPSIAKSLWALTQLAFVEKRPGPDA